MHATFVTLWLKVVQPLANVHDTEWTPHVKRESDVAQSYNSAARIKDTMFFSLEDLFISLRYFNQVDATSKVMYPHEIICSGNTA